MHKSDDLLMHSGRDTEVIPGFSSLMQKVSSRIDRTDVAPVSSHVPSQTSETYKFNLERTVDGTNHTFSFTLDKLNIPSDRIYTMKDLIAD